VISFHPANSKLPGYIVYRDYINYIGFYYIIYILFTLYMVSAPACPVTLTSVESNSIRPRPALKTLETAQRSQDVSKHVPTCADIFTSWLGRLTINLLFRIASSPRFRGACDCMHAIHPASLNLPFDIIGKFSTLRFPGTCILQ
jgi:hypothetical protein